MTDFLEVVRAGFKSFFRGFIYVTLVGIKRQARRAIKLKIKLAFRKGKILGSFLV